MNVEQIQQIVNAWLHEINPIAMLAGCLVFMVLPPLWKRLRAPGEISDTAKMVIRLLGESGWKDAKYTLIKVINGVNYLVNFRGADGKKKGFVGIAGNPIEPKLTRRDRKAIAVKAREVKMANDAAAKLAKENEVKALVAKSLSVQAEPCSPPKPNGPTFSGGCFTTGHVTIGYPQSISGQWDGPYAAASCCKSCGVASTTSVTICPICKKLKA